jgi:hypothetical protein
VLRSGQTLNQSVYNSVILCNGLPLKFYLIRYNSYAFGTITTFLKPPIEFNGGKKYIEVHTSQVSMAGNVLLYLSRFEY